MHGRTLEQEAIVLVASVTDLAFQSVVPIIAGQRFYLLRRRNRSGPGVLDRPLVVNHRSKPVKLRDVWPKGEHSNKTSEIL